MKRRIIIRQVRFRLIFILASGCFMLVACSGMGRQPTEAVPSIESVFAQTMLEVDDFPSGWIKGIGRTREAPGALGRSVGFHGTDDPNLTWVNVVQQVYLYPDNGVASAAYQTWVAKEFPAMDEKDGWQPAPHLEFSNHADQMTIGYLPVSINGTPVDSCTIVAQYQNMIIIIYGNLTPNRWLTSENFRNVLIAMDRRAGEALASQK